MFLFSIKKFSGFFLTLIITVFFSFFIMGNVFAETDPVLELNDVTIADQAEAKAEQNKEKTADVDVKKAAAMKELADCIKANSGGGKNPVDVCYHKTARYANLNDWADFSDQESVGSLAQKLLKFFLGVVGALALLAVMIGGGMIMLGGTDETLLERGKDILKYTAIGVVIVLLAVTITTVVQTVFYSVQ